MQRLPLILASLCWLPFFVNGVIAQTDDITFNILNGDFQRCAEDSLVQIEIIPNPTLTYTTITLVWNQDVTVTITDDSDLIQSYIFPISELLDGCDYPNGCLDPSLLGECFDIDVFASYTNGSSENNGRIIAFQKPPEPAIQVSQGPYCVGEEVFLTNNTCPGNDPGMSYLWTLPDGTTTTAFDTSFVFTDQNDQTEITLTATNNCGSVTTQVNLDVIGLPQVNALVDTGDVELVIPDNYRLCLNGSSVGVLLVDSSNVNVDDYSWTVSPSSGSMIVGPTDNDSLLVNFTAAGTYTITLAGENGCASDDEDVVTITVVESDILTLNAQPDECPELMYTPDPLDPNATYTIDGTPVDVGDFPVTLTSRPEPYVIVATKETECRDFELVDSFFVDAAVQPSISSPNDNERFCPDTSSVALVADVPGGSWDPDPALTINGDQALFNLSSGAASYTFTYTVGSGDCERSTNITLVIEDQVISLPADFEICQTADPVSLNVTPPGGELTGTGVADPMVYAFDPAGLAAGDYQLTYTFPNNATSCTEVGSFVVTVVEEPELEVGDPIQLCNTTSTLLLEDQTTFNLMPNAASATLTFAGAGVTDAATGAYVPGNLPVGTVDTVVITYENIPGCLTRDTLLVEITGIVMPDAGADTTICGGGNSFFLGDPQGGCWTGDGAVCAGNVNLSGLAPGTYSYTLTLGAGSICESSDTKMVTIVPGDGVGLSVDEIFVCDTANMVSLPTASPTTGSWAGELPIAGNDISTAGAAPGDYSFTYTVASLPEGCNARTFTLSILAEPQLGFEVDSLGCAGVDCLDFTATGDPADSYRWDFDDGNFGSGATTCHTYDVAGIYTVGVTGYRLHPVTGAPLCTNTPPTSQLTILEPPPTPGIAATADTVCPGESVSFTRLVPDDSEFLTFVWDAGFGPDTVADLGAVAFPSPLEDTVYTIYLETFNRCGSILDSVELVVRANPLARIGVVFAQPCSGADLILTNLGTGTIDTSIWTTTDGQQFTTFQPPVLTPFTDSMARDLGIQLIVGNVCRMDTFQTTVTIEPTDVRALPSFTDTTVCLGTPFTLTNNSTPGAGFYVVFSDGNRFDLDSISHTLAEPGDYTFTAYATGCGYDSSNWHLRIIDLPELTVAADSVICPYEPMEYVFGGTGVGYDIRFGDQDSTTVPVGDYTFPYQDTTVTVWATTSDGIEGCTQDLSFDLLILPQPAALAAVSDSVCAGSPVELRSLDPSGFSCRWAYGDGAVGDGCLTEHTYAESGLYLSTLIVTSNFGCTDTVQTPVYVEFTPSADFALDFDPESCGPHPVDIMALTDPSLASSYAFDLGDGNFSSLPDFTHTYFRGGEITVSLRVGWNGICFAESSQTIDLKKRPFAATELTDDRCNPSDFVRLDIFTEDPTDMSMLFGPGNVVQNGINRFEFNVPGTYEWEVISEDGCDTSGVFFVPEKDSLIIRAEPDYAAIELGDSVAIRVLHNLQGLNWIWTNGQLLSDSTISNPVAIPQETTTFFVTAVDSNDCRAQDTILIEVEFNDPVFVPNAISENGDGVNDRLVLFMRPGVAAINEFEIYDRWGEMVYQLEGVKAYDPAGIPTWDGRHRGKRMNPQVFVYRLKYVDRRGFEGVLSGDITLLR